MTDSPEQTGKELLCKLTSQTMQTHGYYSWVLGEWRDTNAEGELCGPGWLHAYMHPLLAVLLNPLHMNIDDPRLFLIEAAGQRKDDFGLKVGFTRMRLVHEMSLPAISPEQQIAFGIICALEVYGVPEFVIWARGWLEGQDRSTASAASTANAAAAATNAAATNAASAANAAANAAVSAANAAANAAMAASAASRAAMATVDLISLAKRALVVCS